MKTDVLKSPLSERILLLTVSLIDILAYYCALTKNTKICTYSAFQFPACILAPFLIPDSFVATPHWISCLYTK